MNYKPIYGSKKKKTAGTTANDLNQFKANFQSLSLSKPETTISFSFALRRLSFLQRISKQIYTGAEFKSMFIELFLIIEAKLPI